ncbi:MAG: hypothetical protein H8K07_16965 [Nitrospira sp.]|nr:hypothetical protein [Nitrospira sp.]
MALTTTGLTNGGTTTHYQFQYDDSLAGAGGPEPARTNAMMAACENDFNLMSGWFGNIALTVSTPIAVNVVPGPYASAGWGPPITLKPGNASNAILCRYLLVSEVTEMFMLAQNRGWFAPDGSNEGSAGEGLSRFLASQFLVSIGQPPAMPGFGLANGWMNSPRQDFVNHIDTGDHGIDAKTGCSILFIYYLFTQLGFTINQIVAAAASELAGVYANVTGDGSDPFPFFKQLLDTAYPGTTTIGGANPDNPFPLGILSFWVDKSTFGRDEVTDVISSASNGTFPNAYWLVLEGFNKNKFNSLGIITPTFVGPFANLPGIGLSADGSGVSFETSDTKIPQRIRFPFDIGFTNATLGSFPAPGNAPLQEPLTAVINVGGAPLLGASALTEFELISGADPYYTNMDTTQNNVFWLSQDLRVFTASPSLNNTPVPGAPAFSSDSFSGAYNYIQGLLAFLNNPANHFTDGTNDPFASGVIPDQAGSLTADSSVSRFTLAGFPPQFHSNYNFAVARVRLRGTAGPAGQAQHVKVFFRLWSTQTADTGFDPGSTYLSHQDGGHPHWPLPAPDAHTIPFFAMGNSPNLSDPNNPEYGIDGINNQTIAIVSGDKAYAYFGCFLNVYDPGNVVNGAQVQALLAGTHHCLVAEIAYDDAPIISANGIVAGPERSDKLAQRNLQLTFSDNPGPADTHRIPQTFDLRPAPAIASRAGALLDYPDELMIDWGRTPAGAVAHIYWPQINTAKVLSLAGRLYGAHLLSAGDSNTIDCQVTNGVSYIPIPPGNIENIAGLLTVDLPQTVSIGQEFNIIVRRISTRRFKQDPIPAGREPAVNPLLELSLDKRGTESGPIEEPKEPRPVPPMRNWRYVTGTFQVKIPVTTPQIMLRPDEDALAVMRWRLQSMSPANRWHLVLKRYIEYVSARIAGLGGNPNAIPPSPNGAPGPTGVKDVVVHTGKVVEIIYDCFGRFEAFVLNECGVLHTFQSRECEIEKIALRACRDCLLLSVYVEENNQRRIRRLAIKC